MPEEVAIHTIKLELSSNICAIVATGSEVVIAKEPATTAVQRGPTSGLDMLQVASVSVHTCKILTFSLITSIT